MKKHIFLLVVAALMLSCGNVQRNKTAAVQKTELPVPEFNADSAYSYVMDQCMFGPRVPGTTAHAACLDYLVLKFNAFAADTVIVQTGQSTLYDGTTVTLKNVIATYNPDNANRIMICSHWDSRPFADHDPDPAQRHKPIDGANDGASGVGIILELARQLSLSHPDIGVDFILFDLEDWGAPEWIEPQPANGGWALGSEYWARHPHTPGYQARYGILLDMVGAPGAMFFREYLSDRYASWVTDKVWNRAAELGLQNMFVNRQGGAVTDDHLNVNRWADIPCIDIIQYNPGCESGFYEHWHTRQDTHHNIDPATLGQVGTVLINLIYKP